MSNITNIMANGLLDRERFYNITGGLNSTEAPLCKLSEGNAIHVVGALISFIIVVENALVLAALSTRPRQFKMVLFIFIKSLAVSDLLSGVVFFYSFLFNDLLSLDGGNPGAWTFRKASIIGSLVVSVASLQLISMDRFISVTNPLDHDKVINRPRAFILVAAAWLLASVFIVAPLAGWNCIPYCVCETATLDGTPNCPHNDCSRLFPPLTDSYVISSVVVFVVLTTGITFCNAAVFATVRKHFTRMSRSRMSKKSKRDERELAVFMATVFIVFLVCWLPAVILLSVDSTQPGAHISDDVFDLCSMPALLNSLINPWLYAIKLRSCRKVLVNWLCKCVKRDDRFRIFKISESTAAYGANSIASGKSLATKSLQDGLAISPKKQPGTEMGERGSKGPVATPGNPEGPLLLKVSPQEVEIPSSRTSMCSGSD